MKKFLLVVVLLIPVLTKAAACNEGMLEFNKCCYEYLQEPEIDRYAMSDNNLTCPASSKYLLLKPSGGFGCYKEAYCLESGGDVGLPDPAEKNPSSGNNNPSKINYQSLCIDTEGNHGIREAFRTIGYIIKVVKWIAPLIIIILGMIDFGKAVVAKDDKAIGKATASLIKRIVGGIVIFLIPTLILGMLSIIEITQGIEKEDNATFGTCTKCVFDPDDCKGLRHS